LRKLVGRAGRPRIAEHSARAQVLMCSPVARLFVTVLGYLSRPAVLNQVMPFRVWKRKTITLYRPVGPKELRLLEDSGFRRWSPSHHWYRLATAKRRCSRHSGGASLPHASLLDIPYRLRRLEWVCGRSIRNVRVLGQHHCHDGSGAGARVAVGTERVAESNSVSASGHRIGTRQN
jgi:hypothetical protein